MEENGPVQRGPLDTVFLTSGTFQRFCRDSGELVNRTEAQLLTTLALGPAATQRDSLPISISPVKTKFCWAECAPFRTLGTPPAGHATGHATFPVMPDVPGVSTQVDSAGPGGRSESDGPPGHHPLQFVRRP